MKFIDSEIVSNPARWYFSYLREYILLMYILSLPFYYHRTASSNDCIRKENKYMFYWYKWGPCHYLHVVGPGNFWSACQMPTKTGGRGQGFRYVWFPLAAALGMWILDFVAIPEFSSERKRSGFWGDFKAAMSFDQSPLATSSGVGSSGWAMLQRRQDTISEGGCGDGCDNDGVHKGLVFTVIVTRSLSSILLSTF